MFFIVQNSILNNYKDGAISVNKSDSTVIANNPLVLKG